MLHTKIRSLFVIGSASILASCGGGSGGEDNNDDPALLSGYFLDSAVEGLEYTTFVRSEGPPITYNAARPSSLTDKNGTFKYKEGEYIEFRIGYVSFDFLPAKQIMTPYDMASNVYPERAGNIATFIQSLDSDATLSNGIEIIEAVRDHANTFTSFPGFNLGFQAGMPPIIEELTSLQMPGKETYLIAPSL